MREIELRPGEQFICADGTVIASGNLPDGTKVIALAPRQIETSCIPMIVKTAGGLDVPRDEVGCPIDPAMFGPGEYDRDKGVISFSLADMDGRGGNPPAVAPVDAESQDRLTLNGGH